jgi:hypothetical protein
MLFNYLFIMIKTKIKKITAIAIITTLIASTIGLVGFATSYATQIGTGSVIDDSSYDSDINWDDTFGNEDNASGSVTNILIQATVVPSLNMEISTGSISLGTMQADIEATGSLDLEVGTNAANGVTITARSQSGGLTNTTDSSIQLNDLTTDGVTESYRFFSEINADTDSTVSGFTQTADLDTEVDDNATEHTVYTSNKPQSTNGVNDITFTIKAKSDAQTPAGTYQDKITFTVTGNF